VDCTLYRMEGAVTITFDSIRLAMLALEMRGERPVRIWLTRDDLGQLVAALPPARTIRMRFTGVPVNVTPPPTRSRVVSASGATEYVI
jgi:hypothetical protein